MAARNQREQPRTAEAFQLAIVCSIRVSDRHARRDVRAKIEGGLELSGVAHFATGQVEIERIAVEVGLEVDFRREAAARAAGAPDFPAPCILPLPAAKQSASLSLDGSPQPPG